MKYIVWISIGILNIIPPSRFTWLGASALAQDTPVTMPPVRRIGLASVLINTQEIRGILSSSGSVARGLVAEALDDAKMRSELLDIFESAFNLTGRFWIAPTDSMHRSNALNSKELSALQKTYDLDAWAKLDIRFTPDSTFFTVTLYNALDQQILAREDLASRGLPTRVEVKESISSVLPRLISTLGHDGRVIFQSQNFVTLDFGATRGLFKGAVVTAGNVYLSLRHPKTGEPMSVWRQALAQLEIVEVTPSSAVAKVKAIRGPLPETLLAWVAFDPNKQTDILKSASAQKGDAQKGFLYPSEVPAESQNGSPDSKQIEATKSKSDIVSDAKTDTKAEVKAEPKVDAVPKINISKQSQYDDPSSWNLMSFNAGLAISLGQFYVPKKKATRNTDLSDSVINQVSVGASYGVDKNLFFRPRLEYSVFQGGDVEGSRGDISLPVLYDLGQTNSGWQMFVGAGGSGVFGDATARYVVPVYSRNFSDFSLTGHGAFASPRNDLIQGNIDVSLDISSLLASEFGANFGVCLHSDKNLPKELGITLRYNHSSFRWQQYSIGVDWDFGQSVKQSAP